MIRTYEYWATWYHHQAIVCNGSLEDPARENLRYGPSLLILGLSQFCVVYHYSRAGNPSMDTVYASRFELFYSLNSCVIYRLWLPGSMLHSSCDFCMESSTTRWQWEKPAFSTFSPQSDFSARLLSVFFWIIDPYHHAIRGGKPLRPRIWYFSPSFAV